MPRSSQRGPAPDKRRRPAPVTTTVPDPAVWRRALGLAQGNAARIEVVSPTEVIVRNVPVR